MPPNAKGYYTQTGYMGLVEGKYMLFASETDYMEYLADFMHERSHNHEKNNA